MQLLPDRKWIIFAGDKLQTQVQFPAKALPVRSAIPAKSFAPIRRVKNKK
jgi:hypothetical protein